MRRVITIKSLQCMKIIADISPQPCIFNHSEPDADVMIGDTATFTCDFTGFPPLQIEWNFYRDNRRFATDRFIQNRRNRTIGNASQSAVNCFCFSCFT